MIRKRKIYNTAFKLKAAEFSNERSNITELARELGIRVTMLYKWRKDYEKFGEASFPAKPTLNKHQSKKHLVIWRQNSRMPNYNAIY